MERITGDTKSVGETTPTSTGGVQQTLQRCFDLPVAIIALILLSPFLAIIALAIRLNSPGPALFHQQRLGKGQEPFTILKFRSMYINADDAVHREAIRLFAEGRPAVVNGKAVFKPTDDPRVTKVGKFLRAMGLDELPQLINVIRGEMSIVGPRPAIAYELELYKDWYYWRFAVRPGITGLWQISRSRTTDLEDMVRQDIEYIESFSLWQDIKIVLLTVPKIFLRGWSF